MRSPLYSLSAFKAAFALAQLLPRPVTRKIADALSWWSLRKSPDLAKVAHENLAIATGRSGGRGRTLAAAASPTRWPASHP